MPFTLRPYQVECFQHAREKNTIASLPTGYGKTLIAARLIDHYLTHYPDKKIAFLVPTRALVEQQAAYCEQHCNGSIVVERVFGEEQAKWRASDWAECCNRSHVFLGTAALFQKVFVTDKFLSLHDFSLLVFDECHNCVGNSPMASVMRDAVSPCYERCRNPEKTAPPRILGLTASFVNGSLRNIQKKRQTLEKVLLSTIICPNVPSRLESENFTHVIWARRNANDDQITRRQESAIEHHVREAITSVARVKEMTKVLSRCSHVFRELGSKALRHYVQHVIVSQIRAKITVMEQLGESHSTQAAARMRSLIPALQHSLNVLWRNLGADPDLNFDSSNAINGQTNKLKRLLELLNEIFTTNREQHNGYRGIVFVEQIALVSPLASQINEYFENSSTSAWHRAIRCGAVAGTGAQTNTNREARLNSFRLGETQILVATAALEEGVDVSDCAFVMRFNPLATTKAHIQGSGRARHSNAHVYYFENSPEQERVKEGIMTSVARDDSLQLSEATLRQSATVMNVAVHDRHPYPFFTRLATVASGPRPGGEVNVYNCKQILNQYCSMTLGQSVSPKTHLYKYQNTQPQQRKILSSIRYPTPTGWQAKTADDYQYFWSGVNPEQVFGDEERIKKKSASEREEMMFVYVVVVELRSKGFLDASNKPCSSDPNFSFNIKLNCSLTNISSLAYGELSLKNNRLF